MVTSERACLVAALAVSCAVPAGVSGQQATYARDVAPILYKHCVTCHRPGEIGPFPLLTYDDASKKARHIVKVTASGQMPPWHAAPGPFRILDERRLTRDEIDTLAKWEKAGAPPGDLKNMPPPPQFHPPGDWHLGKPDLIVEMDKPFTVPADGPDVYKTFVLTSKELQALKEAKHIRAVEFRPGNRKVVHHAVAMLDPGRKMRNKLKQLAPGAGAEMTALTGLQPFPGLIGIWNPGAVPRPLPAGVTHEVRPDTDLVLQIHYHPVGKEEKDRSSVGLYFTDTPGTRTLIPFLVRVSDADGNTGLLKIKAGKKNHKVELKRDPTPADATLYGVAAHGHYLLKELKVSVTTPDGKRTTVLDIPRWDFNWQGRYHFADPPLLPKGTRVELVASFDNSEDNPQNPSSPPRDVKWGENTTDEMLGAALMLMPEDRRGVEAFLEMRKAEMLARASLRLPPGGIKLPAGKFGEFRAKLDPDGDGVMTQQEFDRIPLSKRQQVAMKLREAGLVSEAPGPDAPPGPDPGAKPALPEVRLPPGGLPIPEGWPVVRERYDTNKDGRLTQDEFEAMPEDMRRRAAERLAARRERGGSQGQQAVPRKGDGGS